MISIDVQKTGRNIKRLCMERGLSVKALSAHFPYQTLQAIYNWQQGKNLPSPENMLALGMILDTPLEQLYSYTQSQNDRRA